MAYVNQASDFGYGTQLTSTQLQNLRDNVAAICNADSGAPPVYGNALNKTIQSTGTLILNPGSASTISSGAWIYTSNSATSQVEYQIGASWYGSRACGFVMSDGVHARVRNTGVGTDTIYYFQL